MVRALKKRELELYMARLVNTGTQFDDKNSESAKLVKYYKSFRKMIADYVAIFWQKLSQELLPKKGFEFDIQTDSTAPSVSRPVLGITWQKAKSLRKQLDELLRKGLIQHQTSPFQPQYVLKKKKKAPCKWFSIIQVWLKWQLKMQIVYL